MTEASQTPKLLCVDDEPSIVEALERMFKKHFQVQMATSPEEGLDWLGKNPDCAVIISDYQMPNINGVEFLKQARILAPNSSRAILSGQIDLHKISEAINHADIHKFILKPWENDYLRIQVLEALQTHQTLREHAHFKQLSVTDPVTELTNHRFFQDQLRRELVSAESTAQPVALAIFDVDHFKSFNDRFGHPEGDRLLFNVAQELRQLVGTKGYVSRYGGEEFTLLMPALFVNEALQLCESIRQRFERISMAGPSSSPAYVTVSAGLAVSPEHATGAQNLIEAADRALYQAKRQGRNQVAVAARKAK